MDIQNSKNSTIHLIKLLAPVVSSREIINEILDKQINEQETVVVSLDFSKIEFISRSAAHELLKLKERFENKKTNKKEVIFINMDTAVSNMIRTVAANRAYSMSEDTTSFKAEKVDILQLV